ncbi:MAG: flavodoxin [Thermoplasmatota archaeon]
MRTLVVYYSLEGNTECIAKAVASRIDADIERLETKKKIKADEFMNYYWGGKKDRPSKKVPLKGQRYDPNEYDLIFIGTPVWAWAPAPPIYSYITDRNIRGRNIALFSCSEGDPGKTCNKLKRSLEDKNDIIAMKDFVNPVENETCDLEAGKWAEKVLKQKLSS